MISLRVAVRYGCEREIQSSRSWRNTMIDTKSDLTEVEISVELSITAL